MTLLFVFLLGQTGSAQRRPVDITLDMLSDGHPVVTIKNNSVSPITGIVMTVNPSGGDASTGSQVRSYFDVYINRGHDLRILSAGSHTMPVAHVVGIDKSTLKPQIRAVIFEDGSKWGDVLWVSKIVRMRKRLFDELGTVGELLDRGISSNSSADQIRTEIERERDIRVNENQSSEVEISQIDNMVLAHAAEELRRTSQVNSSQANTELPIAHLKRSLEMWRRHLGSARTPRDEQGTSQLMPSFNSNSRAASTVPNFGVRLKPAALKGLPRTLPPSYIAYAASCDAADVSVQITPTTVCGTRLFELMTRITDGTVIDMGQAVATGQCIGSYTDCQGTPHNATTSLPPTRIFFHNPLASGVEVQFSWTLDEYTQATFTGCSCNDPNPQGSTLVPPVDQPFLVGPTIVVCH